MSHMPSDPLPPTGRKPSGCPPELWRTLVDIRQAQRHLRDYETANDTGRKYHKGCAESALEDAHNALSLWIDQSLAGL